MATEAGTADPVCSICHEQFHDPKVLYCGHELCAACLLTLLTSQKDAPCPLCLFSVLPPDWGQSMQSFVDSLPTDVCMKVCVDSQHIQGQDHTCQSCLTQVASSLCLPCHDFLCFSCSAMHGRLSATRHHQVEPLSSLTPQKLAAGSFPLCQTHPTELSRLYCTTHQADICVLCAASQHRNCREVKDARERAAEIQALLTDVVITLTEEEMQLHQVLLDLDALELDTEKAAQQAEAEINASFGLLEASLKLHQLSAREESHSKFSQRKAAIQEAKACLQKRRVIVTKHKSIAEQGKEMGAFAGMGQMAEALKKSVQYIYSMPSHAPVVTTVTVEFNSQAMTAVEKALAEVSQVKVTPWAAQAPFFFHNNCGKNIVLSNSRRTAERMGTDNFGGIVVASNPMVPGHLYEVHLDEKEKTSDYVFVTGVITSAPGIIAIPDKASGWTEAVLFYSASVVVQGTAAKSNVGKRLASLSRGSRVGMLIDDRQFLHLYVNGQDEGHADTEVTQPCFPFFHPCGAHRKITALPVTAVP